MRKSILTLILPIAFVMSFALGSINAGAFGSNCEDQIFNNAALVCGDIDVVGYLCPTDIQSGGSENRCQCYFRPSNGMGNVTNADFVMSFSGSNGGCTIESACSCHPRRGQFDQSSAFSCVLISPDTEACRFTQYAKAIWGGKWLIHGFELTNNPAPACNDDSYDEKMFRCSRNETCQNECEACRRC